MDNIFGLPAHPLLVHLPVVLVPLAALGALVMLCWPRSRRHIAWITAGVAVVGALGAILAAGAGESLEDRVRETAALEEHAEAGEMARTLSIVFAVLVVAFVVWDHLARRKAATASATAAESAEPAAPTKRLRNLMLAGAAVTVIAGGLATYSIVDAGHSGAESSWGDVSKNASQEEKYSKGEYEEEEDDD
jgi:uncharacterized membrane protein